MTPFAGFFTVKAEYGMVPSVFDKEVNSSSAAVLESVEVSL